MPPGWMGHRHGKVGDRLNLSSTDLDHALGSRNHAALGDQSRPTSGSWRARASDRALDCRGRAAHDWHDAPIDLDRPARGGRPVRARNSAISASSRERRRSWISASVVARMVAIAPSLSRRFRHAAGASTFRTADPIMAVSSLADGGRLDGRTARRLESLGRPLLHIGGAQMEARRLATILGRPGKCQ